MPIRWRLFWIICLLQLLAVSFFAITSLIRLFETGSFFSIGRIALFILMALLAILAINLLNTNYPDVPVSGRQKSNFNRLFLLNFIFLAYLFAIVISEYHQLSDWASVTGRGIFQLPLSFFPLFIIYATLLLFQFIILYGLYTLRRELSANFMKKEFEFEKDQR